MFQHEEGRAGIRGEYPVLFSRENLPLLLFDTGSYRTGHKKPGKADAYCRNTNPEPTLLPYRMGFYEIIRSGTHVVFLVSHHRRVCHDFLPDIPFAISGRKNPPKGTSAVFFYRAVGGDHQSSPRASSISSIE